MILCPPKHTEQWKSFEQKLGKDDAWRMWLMHGGNDQALDEMERILDPMRYSPSKKLLDLELEANTVNPVEIPDAAIGEKTHRYEDASTRQPIRSVSEVLDDHEQTKYNGTEVGSVYAEKGSTVHKVFQHVINNTSDSNIIQYMRDNKIPEASLGKIKATVEKLKEKGILASEITLADTDHNIAGTSDIVVLGFDGTIENIDIKTAHKTSKTKGAIWDPILHYGGYKSRRYPTQTRFYGRLIEKVLKQPVSKEWILPIEITYIDDDPNKGILNIDILEMEDTADYGFSRAARNIVDEYFGDRQPIDRGSLAEAEATTEFIETITGSPEGRTMDYDAEAEKILSRKETFRSSKWKNEYRAGHRWVTLRGNDRAQWKAQVIEDYLKKNDKAQRNIIESMINYHHYKKDAFLDDPGPHGTKIAENVKTWVSVYGDKVEMYDLNTVKGFENKKGWLVFQKENSIDLLYMGADVLDEKISANHDGTLFGDYMTKGQAKHFLGSNLKNTRRDAKRLEGALIMMTLKNSMPEINFERAFVYSSVDNRASSPSSIRLHELLPVIQKLKDRSEFQDIIPKNLKKILNNDSLYNYEEYAPDYMKEYQDYVYAHNLIKGRKTILAAIDQYTTDRVNKKTLERLVAERLSWLDAKNDPDEATERYLLSQMYYELKEINTAAEPLKIGEKIISMPNNIKNPILADLVSQVNTALNRFKQNYWNKYKAPSEAKLKALFRDGGIVSSAQNILLSDTRKLYNPLMKSETLKVLGEADETTTVSTFELIPEDSPAFKELSTAQQEFITMFNDNVMEAANSIGLQWQRGRIPLIRKTALRQLTEGVTGQLNRDQVKDIFKNSIKENFIFTESEELGTSPHGVINLFANQANTPDGDPRLEMLGITKDGYVNKNEHNQFETNLEIVLDMFMMNANKVKELERAGWVFSAAKSLFEYQKTNFFERSLGGSIDWVQVWRNAILNNLDKVDTNVERNLMRAIKPSNFLASLGIIGFKPTTAIIATMGQELTLISKSIGNKFHDAGLFNLSDFMGATKHLVNPKNTKKIEMILNQYGLFDMDVNTLRSSQRRVTDKFLFNTKFAYMFLRWGDWATRAQAIIAQMIHDGTWDAHSIVDGQLVYDESKDKRFNGKGRFTLEQGQALKKAIASNLDEEGYLVDGRMTRAYDDNLVKKHKDLLDSTLGGMDKETRGWYNYHWLGKLLGVFKSWLPARLDEMFQRPGVKPIAGDYRFIVNEKGELSAEWTGLQVEGLIYTLGLMGFNIKQKMKGLETKPLNEAQKANMARFATNLVMIGMGVLAAAAIPEDDDSRLDEEGRRLITGSLQDVMASYLIMDHIKQIFAPPVALAYMLRLQEALFEIIVGVPMGDPNISKILRATPISRELYIIDELMREN